MKIAEWSLHCYALPYDRKVAWSNSVETSGIFALLRLVSDQGAVGIAEGTLKPTWSGVSARSIEAVFEDFIMPALLEVDVGPDDAVARTLDGIPENRLAKGMADTACRMMRACAAGQPWWQSMGSTASADLSWTLTRQAPEKMAAEATLMCAKHGFRTLKVKGGQGFDTDRNALRAVRSAVGDQVQFYVDANSAYARNEAPDYVRLLADEGALAAEDPCPILPDREFEALQKGSSIPVLVDRFCSSQDDAARLLACGARAVSAKPGRIGLGEALAIRQLASAAGAKIAIGIYAESALGTLINLQFSAAIKPEQYLVAAEQSFFLMMKEQVLFDELRIVDGKIGLPTTANLDELVDWEKLKRFSINS